MRLEMGRIDHQPGWFAGLACQFSEDFVEDAEAAPAHEPIVDGLVRTVLTRRIAPAQTVSDDEDDAADHPPVINPRDPMRQRKIGFNTAHLRLGEQKQIGHHGRLPATPMNQPERLSAKKLMGPEPSTTLADLLDGSSQQDSRITFSMIHGWSAFWRADHG